MEYSVEKSQEESEKIRLVQMAVSGLDSEYLKAALDEMQNHLADKAILAVLNPNPMTHNQKQDLDSCKLKVLELILNLKDAMADVASAQEKLKEAEKNEKFFKDFFK